MMGSSWIQNVLVAAIVFVCAASPGLNVNHALYEATLSPAAGGAAQRGLGNSDDPILVTFREMADLRAEFQFVMKQFLYIALGGNLESSEFTRMTAEFEARLDQAKTGDASKNIIAPPDDGIQACVDGLVNGTASLIPILTSSLGGTISESTWVSIDSEYSYLVQKFSQVLRKYEGHGKVQGVAMDLIENYAYSLQTYSEQLAVQSFFMMLNVNSTHHYKQLSDYERRFQTTVERITWGHAITEIPDLTNVCMLQAMLKVREAWYQMELQLQDVRAASGSFPEILNASEHLRTKAMALTSQIAQPSCQASDRFDEAAWKNGISACNLFRELVARTSRLYVEAEPLKARALWSTSPGAVMIRSDP